MRDNPNGNKKNQPRKIEKHRNLVTPPPRRPPALPMTMTMVVTMIAAPRDGPEDALEEGLLVIPLGGVRAVGDVRVRGRGRGGRHYSAAGRDHDDFLPGEGARDEDIPAGPRVECEDHLLGGAIAVRRGVVGVGVGRGLVVVGLVGGGVHAEGCGRGRRVVGCVELGLGADGAGS
jgi:hypothetical protein